MSDKTPFITSIPTPHIDTLRAAAEKGGFAVATTFAAPFATQVARELEAAGLVVSGSNPAGQPVLLATADGKAELKRLDALVDASTPKPAVVPTAAETAQAEAEKAQKAAKAAADKAEADKAKEEKADKAKK